MQILKYYFFGGLIFLGTIFSGFIVYGAWVTLTSDIPTQQNGNPINDTTWNNIVTKLNQTIDNVNNLNTTLSNIASIPTGAIMAFNLTSCPSGWSEFTPARGRFLRGIDNGSGNDPDCAARTGGCVVGSTQGDELKSHTHNIRGDVRMDFNGGGRLPSVAQSGIENRITTEPTGGNETRPKNVAVLYCVKN